MKMNQKYWLVGIIVLSGYLQQETSSHPQLYIRYHFTAEATYEEVEINQSKLIYTYFPEEVANEKCARWLIQVPCWTEEDLRTKEAILSKEEINEIVDLINRTGFMYLENRYGPNNTRVRCYPHILFCQNREK